MTDWNELHRRAQERYEDGAARLPDDADQRRRQLGRMANAAGAAGLTALMAGRHGGPWFARAAERYAVLGEWDEVRVHADYLRTHEAFPTEVADALAFVAAEDVVGYVEAVEDVLASFEARDTYLEDIPVADTVLVLQALAARRGMTVELESELLP